jgi:hypothetical protein
MKITIKFLFLISQVIVFKSFSSSESLSSRGCTQNLHVPNVSYENVCTGKKLEGHIVTICVIHDNDCV